MYKKIPEYNTKFKYQRDLPQLLECNQVHNKLVKCNTEQIYLFKVPGFKSAQIYQFYVREFKLREITAERK